MEGKTEQAWIRKAVTMLCVLSCLTLNAQETEYRMEIGGGVGTDFYLGDANGTPFAHLGGMCSVLLRRIFNPRMCIKANIAIGHISGTSEGAFIPTDPNSATPEGGTPTTVSFSRNLLDVGAQFEMNFWGYGSGEGYKGNRRITPYALAGAGLTVGMGGGASSCAALCLPIGIGVKYKVRKRLNLGLEWTMRFTTSDELDATAEGTQLSAPYGIESSGLKNKDCYSFLMLSLTYDISPKLRRCNN